MWAQASDTALSHMMYTYVRTDTYMVGNALGYISYIPYEPTYHVEKMYR